MESSSAPVTEVMTEAVEAPEVETVESNESEVENLNNDPTESFEDWKKRQDSKQEAEKKDEKPVEKKDEKKVEQVKKEEPKESKVEDVKEFKVGDKTYKSEDIIKLEADFKNINQQYNTLTQQAEQLVDLLKKDPGTVLDRIGASKEAIERWYYETYLEPELLTPEQRQAKEARKYRETREKEENEYRSKLEKEQQENLRKQYEQEFSRKISDSLKEAGIPESQYTLSQMATKLKQAFDSGNVNAQPKQFIEELKNDLKELQKSILNGLDSERLAEFLGEEGLTKIRTRDIEKFKQKDFESRPITQKSSSKKSDSKDKKKLGSVYDILDNL